MADGRAGWLPRRERRYKVIDPHRLRSSVKRAEGRMPPTITAELLDLSSFGTRLSVTYALQFHERFELCLEFPEIDLEARWPAEVCWLRCGENETWLAGCKFESPVLETILRQLVTHRVVERRAYPRHPLTEQATAFWESDPTAMTVRLVNYSEGGFGLVARRSGTVGERVRLVLDQQDDEPVQIVAIVRGLLDHPEGFLICCEYSSPHDAHLLEEYSTLRDILTHPPSLAVQEAESLCHSKPATSKSSPGLSLAWWPGKRKESAAEQAPPPLSEGERQAIEALEEIDWLIDQFQAERRRKREQSGESVGSVAALSGQGQDAITDRRQEAPTRTATPPLEDSPNPSASAVSPGNSLSLNPQKRRFRKALSAATLVTVSAVALLAVPRMGTDRGLPDRAVEKRHLPPEPTVQGVTAPAADSKPKREVAAPLIAHDSGTEDEFPTRLAPVPASDEFELYRTRLARTEQAWTADNAKRALELLAECPPRLRGWEWECLAALCRSEPRTVAVRSGAIGRVVFSPDGRRIASVNLDGKIQRWNPSTGDPLGTLRPLSDRVHDVAFSPDGETLATAGSEGVVELWDTTTGQRVASPAGHRGNVFSLAFSPDGRTLASAGGDRSARLWDATTGDELDRFDHPGSVYSIAFHPGGEYLATGGSDSTVRLWTLATGEQAGVGSGHTGWVTRIAFRPDGAELVTASNDRSVRTWDAESGQQLLELDAEAGQVRGVVYSPDGKRIVASYEEGGLQVWHAATGREVLTLRGHNPDRWDVAFGPDGTGLITASSHSSVRLWQTSPAD